MKDYKVKITRMIIKDISMEAKTTEQAEKKTEKLMRELGSEVFEDAHFVNDQIISIDEIK